jgi:hypothetical protein
MINPNKIVKSQGIVTEIIVRRSFTTVKFKDLKNKGHILETSLCKIPKNIQIGDVYCYEVRFSIMSDSFYVYSISRRASLKVDYKVKKDVYFLNDGTLLHTKQKLATGDKVSQLRLKLYI